MATFRCSTCSIDYPPSEGRRNGEVCRKCSGALEYFTNVEWDKAWRSKAASEATPEAGEAPLPWGPHPDDDACTVIFNNNTDTLHVLDVDIRSIGYLPESGDVVKLNGKYYELLGFSQRGKLWWVEPFYFDETSVEIAELPTETGPSSDDIIVIKDDDGTIIYWNPNYTEGDEGL